MRTFLLLVFTFPLLTQAQTTSPTFDPVYAQGFNTKLAAAAAGASTPLKGVSAAVYVPGQGTWIGVYGEAAPGVPVASNMKFGMASNSKSYIATLMLRLQEENVIQFNQTVANWLPPYSNVNPNITIAQLLNHTSGLFDYLNDATTATNAAFNNYPDSVWTLDALLATIGAPIFAPGNGYSYSNTNFLVAAKIAETATGKSIRDLLHEYIFMPLGLTQSAYPISDNVFGAPYSNLWSGNVITLDPEHSASFLTVPATAGGIWSTASDMVKFYRALFSESWLNKTSQQWLRDHDGYIAYTTGVRVENNFGVSYFYHAGAYGFRSFLMHDPESGITVAVLSNKYGTSARTVAEALFAEAQNKRPKNTKDISVSIVNDPPTLACAQNLDIAVRIKNNGTEPTQQYAIKWVVLNAGSPDTLTQLVSTNIAPGASYDHVFTVNMANFTGKNRVKLWVELISETDKFPEDNVVVWDLQSNNTALNLPYTTDFESGTDFFPTDWVSDQPTNLLDWKSTRFAAKSGAKSLVRNNFWDANINATYTAQLPKLNLANAASPILTFAYAHAGYPGSNDDKMEVVISDDCGLTYDVVWAKAGTDLPTGPAVTSQFVPTAAQWKTEMVSLSQYVGSEILVGFMFVNGYGNLCYIDDVAVQSLNASTDFGKDVDVILAPNPASDYLEIVSAEPLKSVDLQLFDSKGMVLYTEQVNGQFWRIDCKNWPSGLYGYRLGTKAGKWVKQ